MPGGKADVQPEQTPASRKSNVERRRRARMGAAVGLRHDGGGAAAVMAEASLAERAHNDAARRSE